MNAIYLVLAGIIAVCVYGILLALFGRDHRMDNARERYNQTHAYDYDDCDV